jgi:hypothetical protein
VGGRIPVGVAADSRAAFYLGERSKFTLKICLDVLDFQGINRPKSISMTIEPSSSKACCTKPAGDLPLRPHIDVYSLIIRVD